MYEIIRHTEAIDQQSTRDYGITVARSYALLSIPREGQISMSELSEKMRLAKSTMTRVADQLVTKGLIERDPDTQDRRMVQVRLTEAGRQMQGEIEADYQMFFEMVLAELDDPAVVVKSLEQVAKAIVVVMQKKHGMDYR